MTVTSTPSLFSTSTVTKSADSSSTASVVVTANTSTDTTSSVNATVSTKWGFKVDENGFFGTDFNKTAGIPTNVKIHQNQLEMAETYTKAIGSKDDPVTALGKVWSFFSKVAGSNLDPDGSITEEQLEKMPYAFQSNGSLLDNPVRIITTTEEDHEVNQTSGKIQGLSQGAFDTGVRGFWGGGYRGSEPDAPTAFKNLYQEFVAPVNPAGKSENEISISELFGLFSMQEMAVSAESHQNIKNYYSFIESGQDFQSYLTDTFGADYVKNFADGMNKHFKNPDMFDTLMKEIDRHMKDDYASYLSSQNTTVDSIPKSSDNDTSASNQQHKGYQTIKNTKVPTTGSLLSVGA